VLHPLRANCGWVEVNRATVALLATIASACYCRDSHGLLLELKITNEITANVKRGRPLTGKLPMNPAERKRAQRMRDRRAAIEAIGDEENASLRALLTMLGRVETSDAAR
jgi:hypothetical protein